MMEQARFRKRLEQQARMDALLAEIAETEQEIADQFKAPDLGAARVGMLPVEEGADCRWFTTNLTEVVAREVGVAFLHRMDDRSAWLGLDLGKQEGRVGLQIVAKAKPLRLEITPTQRADVRYT